MSISKRDHQDQDAQAHTADEAQRQEKEEASEEVVGRLSSLELAREVMRRSLGVQQALRAQEGTHLDSESLATLLADALSLSARDRAALGVSSAELTLKSNAQPDRELLNEAREADHLDDIPKAQALYLQYLDGKPEDVTTRLRLGRLFIERGELERAQKLQLKNPYYHRAQQLIHNDPAQSINPDLELSLDLALTLTLEAELQLSEIDYHAAHHSAMLAHRLAPDDLEVMLTYAQCCGWVGLEAVESKTLQRAVLSAPHSALAQARFWSCDYFQHPPLDALKMLFDLHRLDRDRGVQHALIVGLLRAQRLDEAHTFAERLVERSPQSQSAQLLLASTLFHLARASESLDHCALLAREGMQSPSLSSLYLANVISLHSSLSDQVDQEQLEKLREWGERSPRVALWYTQFLEIFDHDDEAHWLRERLVERYPESRSAYLDYLQSLLRRGDDERCVALTQRLLDDEPEHLEAWHLMTRARLQRGELDAAERALSRCEVSPSTRESRLRLLIARGHYEEAITLALNLCKQNPSESALVEYLLNALWQRFEGEERITHDLLKIYRQLPSATRPPTLLTLFAYLFFHLEQYELASSLVDEIYASGELFGFRVQRLRFACELARYLRHDEALEAWSKRALELYPDDHELTHLRAVSLWRSGEHRRALTLGQHGLTLIDELRELDAIVEVIIWACELRETHVAQGLLERLASDPRVPQAELNALSLRVWINAGELKLFDQAVELAKTWLNEADEPERVELLLDWCLETGIADDPPSPPRADTEGIAELDDALIDVKARDLLEEVSAQACEWAFEGAQRFPQSIEIRRRLSFILNSRGQIEAAIYAQERALAYPDATAADWLSLAHLYESNDEINQARIAFFEATLHEDELSGIEQCQYQLELACFYLRHGEEEYARSVFEELIDRIEEMSSHAEVEERDEVDIDPNMLGATFDMDHQAVDALVSEDTSSEQIDQLISSEIERDTHIEIHELLESLIEIDRREGTEHTEGEETPQGDTGYLRDALFIWLSQSFEHLTYESFYELAEYLHTRFPGNLTSGFLGIAHLYLDQPRLGLSLLRSARHYDEYFSLEYAHCLWSLEQREEAITLLSELVVSRPADIECRHLLLQMLIEDGDASSAYHHLRELSALAPQLDELTELRERVDLLLMVH